MSKIIDIIKKHIDRKLYKKGIKLKAKMDKHNKKCDRFKCVTCPKKYNDVSLSKRLKMYKKGFTSDQYLDYKLYENSYRDYLTELQRWGARRINGEYAIVLDDKRLFSEVFSKYLSIPRTLFFIENGKIYTYEGHENVDENRVVDSIKKYKGIVLKPSNANDGKAISVITYIEGKFYLNFEEKSENDVGIYIKTSYNCFISEYIFQHDYASRVYNKSSNTIRVITGQNDNAGAEILIALHRFGTDASTPVDNANNGGLFALIDIEKGIVGKAKSYVDNETRVVHPDTAKQIEGIIIPYWEYVKEQILRAANRVPYVKFIVWDILITKNGFTVIEGNTSTDLQMFQLFEPQKNTKLGKFYKRNGI